MKEGFRPIVMIDANDNYWEEKSEDFRKFMTRNNLSN